MFYMYSYEKPLWYLTSKHCYSNTVKVLCHGFFYKQRFFSTQLQYCLTFSWIELQMLLMCCVFHTTIIIMKHILYLAYFCPCLGLVLDMLYLFDPFLIYSLVFIIINHIILPKQMHLFFAHFLSCLLIVLDDNMDEESDWFSNSENSPSGCCLAFAWFFTNFSLV